MKLQEFVMCILRPSSFPRKRESSDGPYQLKMSLDTRFRGYDEKVESGSSEKHHVHRARKRESSDGPNQLKISLDTRFRGYDKKWNLAPLKSMTCIKPEGGNPVVVWIN